MRSLRTWSQTAEKVRRPLSTLAVLLRSLVAPKRSVEFLSGFISSVNSPRREPGVIVPPKGLKKPDEAFR